MASIRKMIVMLVTLLVCSEVVIGQNRTIDTNSTPIGTELPSRQGFKNSPISRKHPSIVSPTTTNPAESENPRLKKVVPLLLSSQIYRTMNLPDFRTHLLPTTPVPEAVTSPLCLFNRPDVKDKRFYFQRTTGLGWIRRRCPQGTGFHNRSCGCSIVISSTDNSCQAEFYFNFERDSKDNSNNSLPVGDTHVQLSGGAGEFTGISKIIMWRYSGAEFRNGITARLSYKPMGGIYKTQALLTNCDAAKTKPTIGIVLNKSPERDQLIMYVRLHSHGEQSLSFSSKFNDWNDVIFSFDGKMLIGTVNGITKTTPASGSLIKGSSGLVLGRCEYYNWFIGFMDEVYVYPCVPRNMNSQPKMSHLPS